MILTPARAPTAFIDVDKDVVNCGVAGRDVTMQTLLPIIVRIRSTRHNRYSRHL